MPTDYICDKCEGGEPITDKVYIVPKRKYYYEKDKRSGKMIVTKVDVLKDKMTLCEKHYQEDLNAEQITVHRSRS